MHSAELRWTIQHSCSPARPTRREKPAAARQYWMNRGRACQSVLLLERRDLGREQLQAVTAAVLATDWPAALAGGSGSVSGTMIGYHRLAWRTLPHLIWQNTFYSFLTNCLFAFEKFCQINCPNELPFAPLNWNRARSYKKFCNDATSAVGLCQPNTQLHSRGGLTGL